MGIFPLLAIALLFYGLTVRTIAYFWGKGVLVSIELNSAEWLTALLSFNSDDTCTPPHSVDNALERTSVPLNGVDYLNLLG